MWRMIRCNNVNAVIKQGFPNALAVLSSFDSRIPFDEISLFLIIGITEPKVVNASFCSYQLLLKRQGVVKKLSFFGR